ncbi:MAG: GNAT family N-acetyltransferase [Desulfovibrio sp.]|nr:GNAT family N-acetyltransferase [Desulfovibrio sp.]
MTTRGHVALVSVPPAGRKAILHGILELWEASVRASHAFLDEDDIEAIRDDVASAALGVPELVTAWDSGLAGFMGAAGTMLEMLFVRPERFGQGIGTLLVRHAVGRLGVRQVDCNEQNPGALAFYRRLGFAVEGRSAKDGAGRPFPLLHLRLASVPWHPDADGFEK